MSYQSSYWESLPADPALAKPGEPQLTITFGGGTLVCTGCGRMWHFVEQWGSKAGLGLGRGRAARHVAACKGAGVRAV